MVQMRNKTFMLRIRPVNALKQSHVYAALAFRNSRFDVVANSGEGMEFKVHYRTADAVQTDD